MMTAREVCEFARISPSTLYRLTRQGRLRRYRISGRGRRFMGKIRRGKVLYLRSEVVEFIRRSRV